jgi:exosortase
MKLSDVVIIFVLALLAAFVWLRDTTWMSSSDDTLPILVALPIFVWLGWPWRFLEHSGPIPKLPIAIAAILFVLGIGGNLTILLAIGWTLLLWTWLAARTDPADHSKIKKLLILPFMAFPWVTLDAGPLGWWFRLSGAHVTAALYSLLGFNVIQEGTHILINSLPVSVEAACAGLNTLQSMLIAGSVVAFIFLGNSNRYWWNLPLLVVMAWVANTLRILVLVAAALIVSPEFALGAFHTWGGWLVLMVMFVCCWLIFSVQEPEPSESKPV